MRTSLTANSLGAQLHINAEGSGGDIEAFVSHEFWPSFVPGVELEPNNAGTNPDLSIQVNTEAVWQFEPEVQELTCPPQNLLHAICVAGYLLEARRQALGLYTLHGNVIANDNTTIALLGPISGIGKTGLSSYAADKGWHWVADEKFVMNEQGEYVGSVNGILQDAKTLRSAGNNEPGEITPSNRKIDAFITPITTDSESLVSHTYDQDKAFWHLNDEMSRDIRMTPFALEGPNVPLPSFDTEALAIRRREASAALSGRIPYLFVMGDEDSILDHLSGSIR